MAMSGKTVMMMRSARVPVSTICGYWLKQRTSQGAQVPMMAAPAQQRAMPLSRAVL